MDYLNRVIGINPGTYEPVVMIIKEFHSNKRWFELGEKIIQLISQDDVKPILLELYENFVRTFFDTLDPFHRAEIVLTVSSVITPFDRSREFLESMLPKFEKQPEPCDLLKLQIVFLHTLTGSYDIAHSQLNEIEKRITESTALQVRSQFHRTQADLDKARGDFDAFYEHALLYLSTSKSQKNMVLAFDLCMAALFSSKVCSFGELAAHPIIDSLSNTNNQWLQELIILLDSGSPNSIPEFNEKFAPTILSHDVFRPFLPVIQQKIALSVFLQMIFSRPFDSRIFDFSEISESCHVPLDRVEWLVMKALSTEIIKGEINELEQKVIVTWCKPKALDQQRLKHLKDEIDRWRSIVHNQRVALSNKAQPVVG